jgi:HAD superfamily hydrolase (TIGR01509 family)
MKIQGLIFDFDGVIVDSEPFWEKADRRLMAEAGKVLIPEAKHAVIGLKQSDSIRVILKMHGLDGDPAVFMKRRERMMEEYYAREIPLNPGAAGAVRALHESGVRMIVASSTPKRLVELCLERFGLLDLFVRVVSGDEVEHGKPAPDIFLKALGFLGLPAVDAAVVEDAVPGLLGARAAGLKAIWYRNEHQPEGEKMADRTINALSELIGFVSN